MELSTLDLVLYTTPLVVEFGEFRDTIPQGITPHVCLKVDPDFSNFQVVGIRITTTIILILYDD